MVDSSDDVRVQECNKQLTEILEEPLLNNVPLCVFANKQDIETSLKADEISECLNLDKIINRNWSLFPCSAIKGDGIQDGIQWLLETIV